MKPIKLFIFLIILTFLTSCSEDKKYNAEIKGNTMGTYYLISLVEVPKSIKLDKIKSEIDKTLFKANKILSNWDKDSEISKLNDKKIIRPIKVSNELMEVMKQANLINLKSKGFFDITLDPLIELWGFGYKKNKTIKKVPSDNQILQTLSLVNQADLIKINQNKNELLKKDKNLTINLSAIGKGYGIDLIGKKLKILGVNNFLINIGGDILTSGFNKKKKDWVIGVENPNLKEKLIKEIINISNKGIASSGDYKNFFSEDGRKYSHILNPVTGKPIEHSTKSVTVINSNAMNADGWATALLAMGSSKGLKVAEKEKIAVIFIDEKENELIKIKSQEFKKLNKEPIVN